MDPREVKATWDEIIALYKNDPEEAHIYEDKFLRRMLRTMHEQLQSLSCDDTDLKKFQNNANECMSYINTLLNTQRTKWYS